jgi:coenzyme F420-reducing hydrogenase gamma subunit
MECKRRGNVCVMVAKGEPCLGPVTHAGCGALCPSYDRGCYGCFGPRERANTGSLADWFRAQGMVPEEAVRRFRGFTGWAEAFRKESERHER